MRRFSAYLATFTLTAIVGCYDASLSPSLDDIYVCDADADCALGSRCIDSVCRVLVDEQDPAIQVISPAALDVFEMGADAAIPIVVAGARLELSNQPGDDVNVGYVEVLLDGAVVDTITAGDLAEGVELDGVAMPSEPGLHHLSMVARRPNGDAFEGDYAQDSIGFWVDDGNEHIGILSPPPGEKIPLGAGEPLTIDVVSLNFTMANPGFVSPDEVEEPGLGYVHLYLDATLPGCLPSCNFEHQSAIIPAGLSRVNRITAEQAVLLPNELGAVQVQVVAQTLTNAPYLRGGIAADYVFHSVPVQSTVEIEP